MADLVRSLSPALTPDDFATWAVIQKLIAESRHPGINTPRRYALRSEVAPLRPDVARATVDATINRLLDLKVLYRSYERDGMRLYHGSYRLMVDAAGEVVLVEPRGR